MSIVFFLSIVTFFTSLAVCLITILRPKLFWPLLIIISVGTAGLLLYVALIDEILLGSLIFGVIGAVILKRVDFKKESFKQESKNFLRNLHKWVFYFFIFYMILQSVRGFFMWEEDLIKINRWIIFYLMLGALAFILSREPFSSFDKRKAHILICVSAFFYFVSYLIHGIFSELVRGINRFDLHLQGVEWSGAPYATFPLVLASAAALLLLKDRTLVYRLLGASLFILGIIITSYYQARITLLTILLLLAAFLFIARISWRKKIILFIIYLIFALIFIRLTIPFAKETLPNYYEVLSGGEKKYELFAKREAEIDRYIHFRAALNTVNNNWKTFLFGSGLYSHKTVMIPYFHELQDRYHISQKATVPLRTEAFSALLVDAGWVGMLLFIMNFFVVAWIIFSENKEPERFILLSVIVISFLWLPVTNILDISLLYLLVMPSGLILQLNRDKEYMKLAQNH